MNETPEAPLKIHFHMNEQLVNALTWEEFESLELAQDGQMKLYRIRPLLARFMMNGDGQVMDHGKAMLLLGKLPINEITGVINQFMAALKESTVPKENGNLSGSPSEASTGI